MRQEKGKVGPVEEVPTGRPFFSLWSPWQKADKKGGH